MCQLQWVNKALQPFLEKLVRLQLYSKIVLLIHLPLALLITIWMEHQVYSSLAKNLKLGTRVATLQVPLGKINLASFSNPSASTFFLASTRKPILLLSSFSNRMRRMAALQMAHSLQLRAEIPHEIHRTLSER